mmetsp:Transcript_100958/g.324088  ORF Transcript_100958/g.324088 Transcript_100958/m.324088 type:complete len:425 (-) Transcript_100958:852-2126(-)
MLLLGRALLGLRPRLQLDLSGLHLPLLCAPHLLHELPLQVLSPALEREERALVLAQQRLGSVHQCLRQSQATGRLNGMRLANGIPHEPERRLTFFVLHGRNVCPSVLHSPVFQCQAVRCGHQAGAVIQQRLHGGPRDRRALLRISASASLVHHHQRTNTCISGLPEDDPGGHQVSGVGGQIVYDRLHIPNLSQHDREEVHASVLARGHRDATACQQREKAEGLEDDRLATSIGAAQDQALAPSAQLQPVPNNAVPTSKQQAWVPRSSGNNHTLFPHFRDVALHVLAEEQTGPGQVDPRAGLQAHHHRLGGVGDGQAHLAEDASNLELQLRLRRLQLRAVARQFRRLHVDHLAAPGLVDDVAADLSDFARLYRQGQGATVLHVPVVGHHLSVPAAAQDLPHLCQAFSLYFFYPAPHQHDLRIFFV